MELKPALFFVLCAAFMAITRDANAQNNCLTFDGDNDKITTSYPGILGGSSRTLEFWMYQGANSDVNMGGGSEMYVGGWGKFGSGASCFYVRLGGNKLYLDVGNQWYRSAKFVFDGKRHHIALVYDSAASKQFKIYIDAKLDTAISGNALNTIAGDNFTLGCRFGGSFFDGDLDEVRLFNYARTDSMIKADMNREYCTIPPGLVLYYKLNDGVANGDNRHISQARDYSGNGHQGTLNNFKLNTGTPLSNYIVGVKLKGGNTRDTLSMFDCDTVVSPTGRFKWTKTGNYGDTLANFEGCDSIILVKVKIGSSEKTLKLDACDSFVSPKQKVHKVSGVYREVFTAYTGCDSAVNYDVNMRYGKLKPVSYETCDSFISSGGKTYYTSGIYSETYKTWYGCDSVMRYNLKINRSITVFQSVKACDSALVQGKSYKQSALLDFKYNTFKGCDSIHKVLLTVNKAKTQNVDVTACDKFISPQNKTYSADGTYTEKYISGVGCDSFVNFKVKINKSFVTYDSMEVCKSALIGGIRYTSSGLVKHKTKSIKGCDSTANIELTVIKIDTVVTRNGNTLTARQSGAVYQWISCGNMQPIPFQGSQSFHSSFDGDYAVVIIWNGCMDTSACHMFRVNAIDESQLSKSVQLTPNPNSGQFNLVTKYDLSNIRILDLTGRVVREYDTIGQDNSPVETGLQAGIYLLEFTHSGGTACIRLVIE